MAGSYHCGVPEFRELEYWAMRCFSLWGIQLLECVVVGSYILCITEACTISTDMCVPHAESVCVSFLILPFPYAYLTQSYCVEGIGV